MAINEELKQRLIKIGSVIVLLFFVYIIFLIKSIERSSGKEKLAEKKAPVAKDLKAASSAGKLEQKFIAPRATEAEGSGILILDENVKPQTQEEWDDFMKANIVNSSVNSIPAEIKEEVRKDLKTSREEYKKRLVEVDKNIKEFEDRLKKDPYDAEAKERLENLLILKAVTNNLTNEIISE